MSGRVLVILRSSPQSRIDRRLQLGIDDASGAEKISLVTQNLPHGTETRMQGFPSGLKVQLNQDLQQFSLTLKSQLILPLCDIGRTIQILHCC